MTHLFPGHASPISRHRGATNSGAFYPMLHGNGKPYRTNRNKRYEKYGMYETHETRPPWTRKPCETTREVEAQRGTSYG